MLAGTHRYRCAPLNSTLASKKQAEQIAMSLLSAYFYDKFLAPAEEACLKEWQRDLLKDLDGDVLEIGTGAGSNLEFYPESLYSLVMSEPGKHMRKQMEKSCR